MRAWRKKAQSLGVTFLEGDVSDVGMDGSLVRSVHVTPRQESGAGTPDVAQEIKTGALVNAAGAWARGITEMCNVTNVPVSRRKRSVFFFHCADEEILQTAGN